MRILGGIVVLQVTRSAAQEDAHPQPPFTIIYSRLLGEEKREKRNVIRRGRLLDPDGTKGAKPQNAAMKESPVLPSGEARFDLSLRCPCRANNGDAAVIRRSYV